MQRRGKPGGRWDPAFGLGPEVGTVLWAMMLLEASFGAYTNILPLYIASLGAPVTIVGIVLGSSGLLRLAGLGPSAALAERFPARWLIVVARTVAGLGFLSAAFATHWSHLFAMVVAAAFGELAFPLMQAHVATHAGEHRVKAFTLVFTVGPSVALGLGPLVTSALIAVWGMRAAFVFAAVCTAGSVLCLLRLGQSRPAAASVGREREKASTYRETLAVTPIRILLVLQGATVFTLALGTSFVPTFLEDERGFSPARIALLGAVASVGSTLFGLSVARFSSLQQRPLLTIVAAVSAVMTALAIFVGTAAMPLIVVGFALRGGFIAAWSLFAATLGQQASDRYRSRAFALCEMIGGLSFSFAPMLAGWLYGVRSTLPMAASGLCAALLVPLLIRAHRRAAAAANPTPPPAFVEPAAALERP